MNRQNKNNSVRVLLVDDEELFLKMTGEALRELGCDVTCASRGQEALLKLHEGFFDVVVLDIKMPEMDGLEVLSEIKKRRPGQEVVMLTGQATVPTAIEAMKNGAFDFMLKPYSVSDLIRVINHASDHAHLSRRNLILTEELGRARGEDRMIGESEAMEKVREFIEMAAVSERPVLITGESGTGKELVARAIHDRSARSQEPLVVVDGSTLREELLVSELFGHEKGAFTGAACKKTGLFEAADRGTVLLDEIGELSASNQAALLRVIEYGTFRPIGALKEVTTDTRIIASTNKDIEKAVASGEFREDLYYRLNGLSIIVPALRERKEDLKLLVSYFLERWNARSGTDLGISAETLDFLEAYDWPGNVREVINVVELAALRARSHAEIMPVHLPEFIRRARADNGIGGGKGETWQIAFDGKDLRLSKFQELALKTYFQKLLERFGGNKSRVAKESGISRSLLYQKLRRLGLDD